MLDDNDLTRLARATQYLAKASRRQKLARCHIGDAQGYLAKARDQLDQLRGKVRVMSRFGSLQRHETLVKEELKTLIGETQSILQELQDTLDKSSDADKRHE